MNNQYHYTANIRKGKEATHGSTQHLRGPPPPCKISNVLLLLLYVRETKTRKRKTKQQSVNAARDMYSQLRRQQ